MEIAVIGGMGKMGRGIALLLLVEQTWTTLKSRKPFSLKIIDLNLTEASAVKSYFREQLRSAAEKGIVKLRDLLKEDADLISNGSMIDFFVEKAMDSLDMSSEWGSAKNSDYIFEAAFEEVSFKIDLFKELKQHTNVNPYFFTNTSSIPIQVLNNGAELEGNIIGFHFYNPPVIQPLMEIIPLADGNKELTLIAVELAKKLKKTVVFSKDIAGFIGNGHFLREIALAFELAQTLSEKEGEEKAIFTVDRITQTWLLRPMGIFQLLDYVGLDVCEKISRVMRTYGDLKLEFPLLNKWLEKGLRGGQNPDGSQREGIFTYEKGQPVAIYSLKENKYTSLPNLDYLGDRQSHFTWKSLQKSPSKESEIKIYFESLFSQDNVGSSLSKYWLEKSDSFMQELVDQQVADSKKSVSEVLKLGFFHLYSPEEVLNESTL